MSPWGWWAEIAYASENIGFCEEYHIGECPTREAVIAEARQSTDVRHEGADIVPFLRSRNKAVFENRDGVAVQVEPLPTGDPQ